MKLTNLKSILVLTLAIAIGSMPVNTNAAPNDNKVAAGLVILGAALVYAIFNGGGEETYYVNNEDDPGRVARERDEERRAQQAAEANRSQEPTPYYPGAVGVYSTEQGL